MPWKKQNMHHATFPPMYLLSMAIASIARDSTNYSDTLTDYSYDYNMTVDYDALDAFTPLPRVNFTEEIGAEEDYCDILGLTTGEGKLPVGCTVTCLSGNQTYLRDEAPCVKYTVDEATSLEAYTNLSCTLGQCYAGVCTGCNRTTWCWKHNIMSMPPPN